MPHPTQSTEQLITRAQAGEDAAFVELLGRVGPRLRRVVDLELAAISSDREPTQVWDDILDETSRRIAEFDGRTEEALDAWLQRVAVHSIRSRVRAAARNYDTIAPVHQELDTHTIAADALATVAPAKHDRVPQVNDDPHATIAPGAGNAIEFDPHATIAEPLLIPPPPPPMIKVFGDYEILETIAKGGMGVVYKARQRKLNRVVALKMILAGQFADHTDIDRFYAEAEAVAQLRHPNIVGIHEVGECDGQHYFSMEYIEGRSLAEMVREHPLSPRPAATCIKKIAEAMHYAHQRGVLHRDLKPSNIMLDLEDEPLVMDFGLAKRSEGESRLTMAGDIMGTPSYMPPEQASGKIHEVSARSDVYSIGATLYELLTGKPPFGAGNVFETIKQVKEVDPVSPRLLNPSVPKDLETICLKCLEKTPERRYGSAQALADELQRYLVGEPIQARPVNVVERTIRWCKRNPWPTIALAVLCFAVFGISAGLWQARVAQLRAETSRDQLLAAINELFTAWGDVTLLNEPGFEEVRAQLLTTASRLYKQIDRELGNDPKIQHELGVSYFRLGRLMFHLRSHTDAREALEAAVLMQRQLLAARPRDEARLRALGESLNLLGNILETASTGPGDNVAAREMPDKFAAAESVYDEAIAIRGRLVEAAPTELDYQRQLLNSRMNRGMIRQRMGDVLADRQQADAAETYYQEALQRVATVQQGRAVLLDQVAPSSPIHQELVQDMAQGYYNIANITWWLGDYIATEQHLQDAVRTFDLLLAQEPGNLQFQFDQSHCWLLAGDAKSERLAALDEDEAEQAGQLYDEALQAYEHARTTLAELARKSTTVPKYHRAVAQAYLRIGDLHLLANKDHQSIVAFEAAAEVLKPLVAEFPAYQELLDQALSGIADAKSFSNQVVDPADTL